MYVWTDLKNGRIGFLCNMTSSLRPKRQQDRASAASCFILSYIRSKIQTMFHGCFYWRRIPSVRLQSPFYSIQIISEVPGLCKVHIGILSILEKKSVSILLFSCQLSRAHSDIVRYRHNTAWYLGRQRQESTFFSIVRWMDTSIIHHLSTPVKHLAKRRLCVTLSEEWKRSACERIP